MVLQINNNNLESNLQKLRLRIKEVKFLNFYLKEEYRTRMVECPSFKGKVFGSNPNVFKFPFFHCFGNHCLSPPEGGG